LSKGVPPLFVDLRPLFVNPAKLEAIESVCNRLQDNLVKFSSYDVDGAFEAPTALLWLYYFLGQLSDFKEEYDQAIAIVEKAIEHTPTLIELFLLKGKIYKVRFK
jgi:peptide alpha-N-acetyltransferase